MDPATQLGLTIAGCITAVLGALLVAHSVIRRRDREDDAKREAATPPPSHGGFLVREDTGRFELPGVAIERDQRDLEMRLEIKDIAARVRSMHDSAGRDAHARAAQQQTLQRIASELESLSIASVETQTMGDRVRGIDSALVDIRAELRRLPEAQARELEHRIQILIRAELAFFRGQPPIRPPTD